MVQEISMSIPIYLFVLIELCFVTVGDLRYQKIPNLWSILNVFAFIALCFIVPKQYSPTIKTFYFSITFILVGYVFFMANIMGGGDSKFLASFFLLVPMNFQDQVFYYLLVATILIGSFLLIQNLVQNYQSILNELQMRRYGEVKKYFGKKFSYAPVILLAWLWVGVLNFFIE